MELVCPERWQFDWRRLVLRPLPLSCLCHVVGIGGACLLFAFYNAPEETVSPAEEIQVEMIPAGQIDSGGGQLSGKGMPVIKNPAPAPMSKVRAPAASGEPSANAAETPDGLVAAGGTGSSGTSAASGPAGVGSSGDEGAGSAAGGGGTSTAASDTAPAESLGSIAARFAAEVEANKEYPYMAVKRGETGVVSVTVTLSSAGNIESVYISGSSGSNLLDKAALQAVRSSCPFSHGAGRSITMTVPIHFSMSS